eukprot:gene3659-3920_t
MAHKPAGKELLLCSTSTFAAQQHTQNMQALQSVVLHMLRGRLPAAVPKRDYQELRSLLMKMEVRCQQLVSNNTKQLEGEVNEVAPQHQQHAAFQRDWPHCSVWFGRCTWKRQREAAAAAAAEAETALQESGKKLQESSVKLQETAAASKGAKQGGPPIEHAAQAMKARKEEADVEIKMLERKVDTQVDSQKQFMMNVTCTTLSPGRLGDLRVEKRELAEQVEEQQAQLIELEEQLVALHQQLLSTQKAAAGCGVELG